MKRKVSIWFMMTAVCLLANAHTFTPQSVLSSGKWVKIQIAESGVYKLTYEELAQMGLTPANVRVYGYGGAMLSQDFKRAMIDDLPPVSFYMEKGSDGVFGAGDYILFYGQGTTSWEYDGSDFKHTRNPYSDKGYYFLSDNAGVQKIAESQTASAPGTSEDIHSYMHLQVHEQDLVNLLDVTGVDGGGREFYGETMTPSNPTISLTFSTPNSLTSEKSTLRVNLAATSSNNSMFSLTMNGQSAGSILTDPIASSDFYTCATVGSISKQCTTQSGEQKFSIKYNTTTSGDKGYLNYVELSTPSELKMTGSYLVFRNPAGYKQNKTLCYHIGNAGQKMVVWNITNLGNITSEAIQQSGSEIKVYGNNQQQVNTYVAVNTQGGNWLKPTVIGAVSNQNLHSLSNIDYVIITPEQFREASIRLARAHEEKDAITWAVVSDTEVYNEFSSGTPDATAYRRIMKMLYDRAQAGNGSKPRWLLLMGDGTYDNRKLLATSGPSLLLTYQAVNSTKETDAYATDDYFGFMRDEDGLIDRSGRMEIGVGRLPVANLNEAEGVVDKLIRYMKNDSYGPWKQQLLFLSDDGDNGMHTRTAEAGAERVRLRNPNFVVNKLYLDAYPQETNASGESYPLAKNRLDNLLREGVLYFNYSGHGGYNNITNEGMMSIKDVQKMTNKNQAFWMFATCSFAHFDSGKRSAAEEAVLNPNGGAIAVFSACRTVYAKENTLLNQYVCDTLFSHKNDFHYDMHIGDATSRAKNTVGPSDSNKMAYVLLGDPAIRLNYPTDLQVKTTTKLDTVRALTIHEVEGQVVEENNAKAGWFNGKLHVTIYDKMQKIKTRDNDEKNPESQSILVYNDYPNIIYRGVTEVTDGSFKYVFMAPKDIRYNYGTGRTVYYTYDENEQVEGVGHNEDFVVGGSIDAIFTDNQGPTIRLYLNHKDFKDGDKTYETPRVYAEMYDEHGINTAGSGIGHDMMLIVDNNPNQSYNTNEYFRFDMNSYQSGMLSYLLPELEDGMHTLSLRAWDLLNNSSTESLRFEVVHGLEMNILSIASYIREGQMHIFVQYDQPDQLLSTEVFIYNIAGQLVRSHKQNGADELSIDLKEANIFSGLYLYNVVITTEGGIHTSKAGKILVN